MNAGEEARHPSTAGHPGKENSTKRRLVATEKLGCEPGNVVDVLAAVPLVPGTDRLDRLGKYHDGV